jgi:hypothetical protein
VIKSINFVEKGKEPKQIRSSKNWQEVQQVLQKLKDMPVGKSLTIEVDTKYPYTLVKRIKESLNPKSFNVYRVKNTIVVSHK